MLKMIFDFHHIANRDDFYRQFGEKYHPGGEFGGNLDALWDVLTGEMVLPAQIRLKHLHAHHNSAQFDEIVATLKEAEAELEGQLRVTIG